VIPLIVSSRPIDPQRHAQRRPFQRNKRLGLSFDPVPVWFWRKHLAVNRLQRGFDAAESAVYLRHLRGVAINCRQPHSADVNQVIQSSIDGINVIFSDCFWHCLSLRYALQAP
jgi:hypothetical protein